jgi:DNA transposition AAA+ family ATPase
MHWRFVKTENVHRGVMALQDLEEQNRLAPGRGLGLIEGLTGTGKTEFLKWYAVHYKNAVKVRSQENWTPNWMLEDLALKLGLGSGGTVKKNMRRLIHELKERPRLVLIDDADRVVRRRRLLETVRDIHDCTFSPIVLVSEGGAKERIFRDSPRNWRRLGQMVTFGPLSAADVQVLAAELADLEFTLEQARRLHEEAQGGIFGQVMLKLADVEARVKANPGQGVTDKVLEMGLKARKAG